MKSVFSIFKSGLQRTKTTLWRKFQSLFTSTTEWTEETFDDLEAALLSSDLGVDISVRIVDDIRDRYSRGLLQSSEDVIEIAKNDLMNVLSNANQQPFAYPESGPFVIMLTGVNGSGKTTTTAKLAHLFKEDGKSVMMAACDTFRAAGVEQVKTWGERLDIPVVAGQTGNDAAATAFDAATSAKAKNFDVLIIDTAGRQHTSKALMEELGKVQRAITKALPGAPHEVWLTVDGTSGSNALIQAREFSNMCPLTGIVVTKLDGSARGGVVVPITEEQNVPIRFVGLGESMQDLQPFDPDMFVDALFATD